MFTRLMTTIRVLLHQGCMANDYNRMDTSFLPNHAHPRALRSLENHTTWWPQFWAMAVLVVILRWRKRGLHTVRMSSSHVLPVMIFHVREVDYDWHSGDESHKRYEWIIGIHRDLASSVWAFGVFGVGCDCNWSDYRIGILVFRPESTFIWAITMMRKHYILYHFPFFSTTFNRQDVERESVDEQKPYVGI